MNVNQYIELGKHLLAGCKLKKTHEEASQLITEQIYQAAGEDGLTSYALVRVYRLTKVTDLVPDLAALTDKDEKYVMALTGTYGLLPEWCDRRKSAGHKVVSINRIAIPARIPMFEKFLVTDMKVNLNQLYETGDMMASIHSTGGRFLIEDVPNSTVIPAQDEFVKPYGVKSLVGFGGLMGDRDRRATLYVLLAFTIRPFTQEMADAFHTMQPYLGTALASTTDQPIFVE